MDPWQQSVEARLADIRVDVATLSERVATLPTKEWISATVRNWLAAAVAISGLITFAVNLLTRSR